MKNVTPEDVFEDIGIGIHAACENHILGSAKWELKDSTPPDFDGMTFTLTHELIDSPLEMILVGGQWHAPYENGFEFGVRVLLECELSLLTGGENDNQQ